MKNGIGFYLPLEENVCILVFASLAPLNTAKDTFILIKTSFRVGKKERGSIQEAKKKNSS
ncbi:hypothetical protein [Helicobacter sp. MIT 05-5294]|uniref:hypothetical protein n=1 Tax=Helicobacter sp. MIT 05-5294 TaxID=1548150 RepID=UPI0010FD503D|nr:hypothetical protein [Helicobacter sp. MIT 05-5294]TLD85494.1 hypothetical protein LS69_009205 [Helicobacter sp. MIT 05-5294]